MSKKQHFLSVDDWSASELKSMIELCEVLKKETRQGVRHTQLDRKSVGLVFDKSSLRTRVSFEVGIRQLGGNSIYFGDTAGKLGEREPVKDYARVCSRYVDGLVVRTYGHDVLEELCRYSSVPVINALSNESHPCQSMSDAFTIYEKMNRLEGVELAYVGDSNNVALSLLRTAQKLGIRMRVASPEGYEFSSELRESLCEEHDMLFTRDPVEAVKGADVIYTDVWTSMGQEEEKEKRLRAFDGFIVDENLMSAAGSDPYIMHCLPAHRGEEISDGAMESSKSIVFDQAENRLHMQKAIMVTLFSGLEKE